VPSRLHPVPRLTTRYCNETHSPCFSPQRPWFVLCLLLRRFPDDRAHTA